MGASQAPTAKVDVTIEGASPDEAVSRELARGILVSEQAIIVPDPPLELLRTSSALTAVITSTLAGGDSQEKIPVTGITRLRLSRTDLNSACAVLRLQRPPQCVPAGGCHSIRWLVRALHSHQGNLWEVMSASGHMSQADQQEGVLTAGTDDGDIPWDKEMNSAKDYFIGICNVCHCCRRGKGVKP
jgi:hypothetical protein